MVFRVDFLAFWIVCNAAFAIIIENYATSSAETGVLNSNSMTFMKGFAIFLASIVVFRVFFMILHLLKFKIRRSFYPEYATFKFDMT